MGKSCYPPIFEKIEDISYELYKVKFGNYIGDNYHRYEGLYSLKDGFIHADTIQLKYTNKIDGKSFLTNAPRDIVVFSKDKKMGVIEYGEISIDALMDEICGFEFSDKHIGEKGVFPIDEIEVKTREYTPGCLILKNEGKYGLYVNKENIIMPIYDYIKCVKITGENARYNDETRTYKYDKYAYFEVKIGNKVGVISDNPKFNEMSNVEYEKIEVIDKYRYAAYFKVYKDGKVGLISSNKNGELYFTLPTKYYQLDIIAVWGCYGDLEHLYIADGFFYNMKEEKILDAEHHSFKDYCYEENCMAFKDIEVGGYVFIYYSNCKHLVAEGRDEDGNIILSNRCTFNISEEKFIVQEDDSYDDNDYYDEYIDDYDYERDTYYALGGDDYDRFREEGGSIDAMMDGMGF